MAMYSYAWPSLLVTCFYILVYDITKTYVTILHHSYKGIWEIQLLAFQPLQRKNKNENGSTMV